MSQTRLYQYCNYSIMSGITVTLSSGTSFTVNTTIFDIVINNDVTPVSFSIPNPLPYDLIINYSSFSTITKNGVLTYQGVNERAFTLEAGMTTTTFNVVTHARSTYPDGTLDESTDGNYLLLDQKNIPDNCAGQPAYCTIVSTGTVVTPPTFRGENDGQIVFSITGTTGVSPTIIWKINGVGVHTGSSKTYTYTGLTTGYYTLTAYQGFCYATVQNLLVPDGQFYTGSMIRTQPANLSCANSPIVLTLQTAINSTQPLPAKSYLNVIGTVSNDTTITIRLNYPQEYSAVFIAKNYPDKSTYFLANDLSNETGVVIGSNTKNEIATSIAEVLQQDLVISRLYYITNSGTRIYLVAKENTPNLNLTSTQLIISDTSEISLTTQQYGESAYDGQLTAGYSVYAEVYINPALEFGGTPNETDYVRVAELILPYQKDNQHKFQVESILKNYISTPKVYFTSTGFTTIPSYDLSYFIKYGEIFPLVTNSQTKKKRYKAKTSYLHAINAALNWEDANNMSTYLGTAASGLNPNFGWSGTWGYVSFSGYTIGTGTTGVQYALYNNAGTSKIYGWTNAGNTLMGVSASTYQVKVSGVTAGYKFVVQRTFTYNSYTAMNGQYVFYGSPSTVLPRNNVKWLTNSPDTLYVQRSSKQYLSFLLERGYANANRTLSCRGDIYFYNGTSTSGITFFNITSGNTTNFGGMTVLSVGYDELKLVNYENSGNTKVRRVDFAVYQSDSINGVMPLTETKSYIYEIDAAPTRFGVAFLNKLGTYDIFDFLGETIQDENISRENYQVPREIKSDGSSSNGFKFNTVYNTQYTKKWTVNSGIIDGQTYEWIQELLQSNEIYSYNATHQNYLTVDSFTSNKSSNTNEFSMQIIFIETIYENNVSA